MWGDTGSIHVDLYRFDGLERADLETLPGLAARQARAVGASPGNACCARLPRFGEAGSSTDLRRRLADVRSRDPANHETTSNLVDGVRALEIALAAQRSAESGEPIRLAGLRARSEHRRCPRRGAGRVSSA